MWQRKRHGKGVVYVDRVATEFARLRDSERRLVELQEAVRWQQECEAIHEDKCVFYMDTWSEIEVYQNLLDARAAVDALIER